MGYIETRINDQLWHVSTNSCIYDSELDLCELPSWWPDDNLTLADIEGIQRTRRAGQAYMSAVCYASALSHMDCCGDDVMKFIEDMLGGIPILQKTISCSGLAVYYLSLAIDLYCQQFDTKEIKEKLEKTRGYN